MAKACRTILTWFLLEIGRPPGPVDDIDQLTEALDFAIIFSYRLDAYILNELGGFRSTVFKHEHIDESGDVLGVLRSVVNA
jgi:hypothetical protein